MWGFFYIFLAHLSCKGLFNRNWDSIHHNHWRNGQYNEECVDHSEGPGRSYSTNKFADNLSKHVSAPNNQELANENEKDKYLLVSSLKFLYFMWLKWSWIFIYQGDVIWFKSSIDDHIAYNYKWLHYQTLVEVEIKVWLRFA